MSIRKIITLLMCVLVVCIFNLSKYTVQVYSILNKEHFHDNKGCDLIKSYSRKIPQKIDPSILEKMENFYLTKCVTKKSPILWQTMKYTFQSSYFVKVVIGMLLILALRMFAYYKYCIYCDYLHDMRIFYLTSLYENRRQLQLRNRQQLIHMQQLIQSQQLIQTQELPLQ